MKDETRQLIRLALRIDATLTDKDRAEIEKRIASNVSPSRVRVGYRQAMKILGLPESTFFKRMAGDPRYGQLTVVKDGRRSLLYLDEVERLRDGHNPKGE